MGARLNDSHVSALNSAKGVSPITECQIAEHPSNLLPELNSEKGECCTSCVAMPFVPCRVGEHLGRTARYTIGAFKFYDPPAGEALVQSFRDHFWTEQVPKYFPSDYSARMSDLPPDYTRVTRCANTDKSYAIAMLAGWVKAMNLSNELGDFTIRGFLYWRRRDVCVYAVSYTHLRAHET